jgi:hypothetical protein
MTVTEKYNVIALSIVIVVLMVVVYCFFGPEIPTNRMILLNYAAKVCKNQEYAVIGNTDKYCKKINNLVGSPDINKSVKDFLTYMSNAGTSILSFNTEAKQDCINLYYYYLNKDHKIEEMCFAIKSYKSLVYPYTTTSLDAHFIDADFIEVVYKLEIEK